MTRCKRCCTSQFPVVDQASRISLRRMAQKADTSNNILFTAKMASPVPTVADGSFAVSKVNAARFIVLRANLTALQDNIKGSSMNIVIAAQFQSLSP
jgi:hypothetical protein